MTICHLIRDDLLALIAVVARSYPLITADRGLFATQLSILIINFHVEPQLLLYHVNEPTAGLARRTSMTP